MTTDPTRPTGPPPAAARDQRLEDLETVRAELANAAQILSSPRTIERLREAEATGLATSVGMALARLDRVMSTGYPPPAVVVDLTPGQLDRMETQIEDLEAGRAQLAAELGKQLAEQDRLRAELRGLRIAYQAATARNGSGT